MDGRDFFRRVREHPELEWLGAHRGGTRAEDEVFVCHPRAGAKFALAVECILEHSWEDLEAVLTGAREPRIMTHVTRIVGYFSQLRNWNRSKIAELRDRHRGEYGLPETSPRVDASPYRREPAQAAVA